MLEKIDTSQMNTLPSDCTGVVLQFCGAKEIGYSLGCTCKAWRPDEKAWERYAKCDPLTRLAHVSYAWSQWCRAMSELRPADASGTERINYWFKTSDFGGSSKIDLEPRFVLQIWSGETLLTTKLLRLRQDHDCSNYPPDVGDEGWEEWEEDPWDYTTSIALGTQHFFGTTSIALGTQEHILHCDACKEMRAGETVGRWLRDELIGVRLGLDCEPLSFRIVALPSRYSAKAGKIAPTVIYEAEVLPGYHSRFLQACQDTAAFVVATNWLRGPEDSAPSGLVDHHADVVFYPIADPHESILVNALDGVLPSCAIRIVRDAAAGDATELIIDEVNWLFAAPLIGDIRLNRLPV